MEEDFEFEQEDRGDLPLKTHIISGSFAGVMEHVALFPVDTIKVSLMKHLMNIICFRLIYKLITTLITKL